MRLLTWVFIMLTTLPALAAEFVFEDIDGGQISLGDLRGKAVLVVNTASRCGFTSQYAGLQKLYDTYKDEGLEILAVPSGDFRQELKSEDMVKQFCEINYGLTIPMTTISSRTRRSRNCPQGSHKPSWTRARARRDATGSSTTRAR